MCINVIDFEISHFIMPAAITHEHEHLSQVPAVSKVHGVLDQNLLSINPSDIDGLLGHVAVDDIQQLDSKTVEDLFKDVSLLPPQTSSSVPLMPQQSNTSQLLLFAKLNKLIIVFILC